MSEPKDVVMYATATCPYCMAARMLLQNKNVAYEEISVSNAPELRAEMEQRSGRRTVPQIFIGGKAVGGYDDIAALDREGRLDEMLGIAN